MRAMIISVSFYMMLLSTLSFAWKPTLTSCRKVLSPLVLITVFSNLNPDASWAVSKKEFLEATSRGEAIDVRNKKEMVNEVKSLENNAKSSTQVRVVDLGGNRGARGLASDGVQGGSLAEQLKVFGGPGLQEREDKSLKNPLLPTKETGIAAQLKLYQKLQSVTK